MFNLTRLSPSILQLLNGLIIFTSVFLCSLLLLFNLPGMELLGISPNWFLIWMVAWSVKRQVWQAIIAGICLGLIYDGITATPPSHIFSLVVVGMVTANLNKQRYIGEDFISIAVIVFFMTLLSETVLAIQISLRSLESFNDIWENYRRIAVTSAILTSLWTPALYYPLERWWEYLRKLERF